MKDINFYKYTPIDGDICIELGSANGIETLIISKLIGNNGKIFAVEASPKNYHMLETCIEKNNLNNVVPLNLAVTEKKGKVYIEEDSVDYIKNNIFAPQKNNSAEVLSLSMDDIIENYNIKKIDYLKVNIEGSEKLMIKGFNKINIVNNLAISCHDFLGRRNGDKNLYTKDLIVDFLLDNNFTLYNRETGTDYKDDWIYGLNNKIINNPS
tara:strand:+ start:30 stop:659 length:630 start_codon:yes stop_codon:yes gene_type:complete